MALPILETPTYELTVPSTKEAVKFRPFLVKEEKLLMLAADCLLYTSPRQRDQR